MNLPDAETVDLLVIGGGVAGLTAAITAAEQDAEVLLVEKQDHLGGSAPWSAGNLLELNGPDAVDHLAALAFGRTPMDVLEAYQEGLSGLRGWLAEHGAIGLDVDPHRLPTCWPNSPGADGVRYYTIPGDRGTGAHLSNALISAAERLGVRVETGTSLTSLLTEGGAVVGAEIREGDRARCVHARSGVVLATGGFENDSGLTEAYLPIHPVFPVGNPGNTGDGLRAAMAVGAATWHMSTFYGFWCFRAPETLTEPAATYPLLFLGPGHLMVDPDGNRFLAETGREAHDALRSVGDFLPDRPNRPSLPGYAIFDPAVLEFAPLCLFGAPDRADWSHDNARELDLGWIHGASSVADLATKLGVPEHTLSATVDRYNAAARAGADPEFARPAASMSPVDTNELFAIEIWPGVATTGGGPRRDAAARVLGHDGAPLPGLFAAGGNGSVWGHLTEHGGGLTDGLVFGAIAARTALGGSRPPA
ncbi:MAG: FAD-dependent oxidoreductase [Actinomycetota bacterium]|nr:FAD-dependent oxidoreductase [Actinomycetota bacterium]